MTSKNDITGDAIKSKVPTKEYLDRFDAIFRKPKSAETNPPPTEDWDEKRIDIIGQNGPTGEHYDETNYKLFFIAGFKSGMAAVGEGTYDLPIDYFYEVFVEQFGLPPKK